MKNILLLTDFSENAKNAIDYAMHFYKKDECTFYVLHVHKAGTYTSSDLMLSGSESIYSAIVKKPKEDLVRLIEVLKKEYNNEKHTFKSIVDFDVFTDAVNQAVELNDIDYIVVGSNGATNAKEVVFGSNTLNIIRNVHCPTIIVPEGFKYDPLTNILLALDSQDSLNCPAFSQVERFIEEHPQHLHVLRINPNDEHSEIVHDDKEHLKYINCEYQIINNVPLHYALSSYTQTNTIDKVALIVKKENFFERFFGGSATTLVSKNIHIPLIIFHA